MDTYTQVPQRVFIDLLEGLSATSSMNAQTDADVARSKENILQWMVSAEGLHQNDDPHGMGCDYLIAVNTTIRLRLISIQRNGGESDRPSASRTGALGS